MKKYKRIFTIVIDSLGIGAMEDSEQFGDKGVNTLGHIAERMEDFQIPNLRKLGIANLCSLSGLAPEEKPLGYRMVMREMSNGKDTMTGHWEMMGIHTTKPFQTFTDTGFPPELIKELEERTGRTVIGNKSASGTEILDELAEEEIATGHMIVYTSADSVLRDRQGDHHEGRMARGPGHCAALCGKKKGEFVRTSNRHDYALKPTGTTALNILKDHGYDVISVGKIRDIFDGEGITESHKSKSSVHGMEQTIELCKKDFSGLCFVNLVDFDALWGHRRDPIGYGKELERFDEKLGELLPLLGEDDLLMITADHGNDPTYTGTDHTREKVPFLAYSPSMKGQGELPEAETFAVIGGTILDNFGLKKEENMIGDSVLEKLV